MIKLTKEKLNGLLYYLSTDNFKNTLIFKLAYIYAKNMREILILKTKDINPEQKTITFNTYSKNITYPIEDKLLDDLLGYIYDQELQPDDYVFKQPSEKVEMGIKKLNYYLYHTIRSLNSVLELNYPEMTTRDFKVLRGQHLYLDGVDIHAIHELLAGTNIKVTKDILNFKELTRAKFPCNSLDGIFNDYTDLEILYEESFHDTELYTVSDVEDSIIIEITNDNNTINIISSENDTLNKKLQAINPEYLYNELRTLTVQGQYKIIDDLRFLKN